LPPSPAIKETIKRIKNVGDTLIRRKPKETHSTPMIIKIISLIGSRKTETGSCKKEVEREYVVLSIPTFDRVRLNSLAIKGRRG